MRKIFLVAAQYTSSAAEQAMKRFMAAYSSQFLVGGNCWLVAAGGTARDLQRQIQDKIGREVTIFVSATSADVAWSEDSSTLAEWFPRQVAAT
jgi:hypothetical protein